MPDLTDEALRDAASHRGLKLVKSRKRKLGVGDYGRYGLVDAVGSRLFGFGDDGLSATADMITEFLRKADASTWQESARIAPNASARSKAPAHPDRTKSSPAQPAGQTDQAVSRLRRAQGAPGKEVGPPYRQPTAKSEPAVSPVPRPEPELVLSVRPARRSDFPAIETLLGVDREKDQAQDMPVRLSTLMGRHGGLLVAERSGLLGCAAWHIIPALEGPIGRMTLLFVSEPERKKGLGRALLQATEIAMVKGGCAILEAMSEIEVRNSNGFWRAVGYQQASYRFVRRAMDRH